MERWLSLVSGQSQGFLASALRGSLHVLSIPYGLAISARNHAFDRKWSKIAKVAAPVVSIGNLTLGGTGKTPLVAYLARWFSQRGLATAIVSRGYRSGRSGKNDEALELERLLPGIPHLQNPVRIAAAQQAATELGSQVILLDDGFQHRQLHRDLDIVLLDATNPFGFGRMFPRGMLREPPGSLRRAHVVIASRANQVSQQALAAIRNQVLRYSPRSAWAECCHQPQQFRNSSEQRLEPNAFVGRPVFAFCGIGNPDAFFQTLRSLGMNLVGCRAFSDHHEFALEDCNRIVEAASRLDAEALICTAKDLTKMRSDTLGKLPLWSLDIEIQFVDGWDPLSDRLSEIADRALRNVR